MHRHSSNTLLVFTRFSFVHSFFDRKQYCNFLQIKLLYNLFGESQLCFYKLLLLLLLPLPLLLIVTVLTVTVKLIVYSMVSSVILTPFSAEASFYIRVGMLEPMPIYLSDNNFFQFVQGYFIECFDLEIFHQDLLYFSVSVQFCFVCGWFKR